MRREIITVVYNLVNNRQQAFLFSLTSSIPTNRIIIYSLIANQQSSRTNIRSPRICKPPTVPLHKAILRRTKRQIHNTIPHHANARRAIADKVGATLDTIVERAGILDRRVLAGAEIGVAENLEGEGPVGRVG